MQTFFTQKIGFVIVTHNAEEYLEKLLNSIPSLHNIIIVDNKSHDSTLEIAKKHECTIIKNETNRGYGAGINLGIKNLEDDCTHVFILNQDTKIKSFNTNKIDLFGNDIIQPSIVLPNGKINVDNLEMNTFGFVYNKNFGKKEKTESKFLRFFSGSAFIISKKLYKEIGEFDEGLFLYYEDIDYAIRCLLKDKKIFLDTNIVVEHSYENSFDNKQKKRLLLKNRKIIINRYFTNLWRKMLFVKKLPKDKYFASKEDKVKFKNLIKPHLINGFRTKQIPFPVRTFINLFMIPYSWLVKIFL